MTKNLPKPLLDALLAGLTSDDGFRARFQANPRAALSEIGVTEDLDEHAAQAKRCLTVKGLPSKETLAATMRHLAARDSVKPHTYAFFEAVDTGLKAAA